MLRISLRITASFLLFAGAAQGAPLLEAPRAFDPMSRTANAVTGPVIASESRLIFGNGAQTALSHLSDTSADWGDSGTDVTAQVFAMEADPGELLKATRLETVMPHCVHNVMVVRLPVFYRAFVLVSSHWQNSSPHRASRGRN